MVPNAMLTQFSYSKYSSQTLTQFSPPTIGWCAILSQFSPDQKPTLQFSPNSHLCSQYSCNSHQLEMAGANAHLMLIYNFHQIGENWLRIGWELSESWNSFLLGQIILWHGNFMQNYYCDISHTISIVVLQITSNNSLFKLTSQQTTKCLILPFVRGIHWWQVDSPHKWPVIVVFGLGRIFRLERLAIFMTEFRAGLQHGAINFHLKPCMFTWTKIDSPFKVIIFALYSKAFSYHLTSTEFLITT